MQEGFILKTSLKAENKFQIHSTKKKKKRMDSSVYNEKVSQITDKKKNLLFEFVVDGHYCPTMQCTRSLSNRRFVSFPASIKY